MSKKSERVRGSIKLETERIKLEPLEKNDIYKVKEWRNDDEIRRKMFSSYFINNYQQENWFEEYCKDETNITFSIKYKSDNKNKLIGTIGLDNIDHFHQRAELGTLIGDKKFWGKGIATEALNLLLEYSFCELNLNKVFSYIFSNNKASIKKNKKNGFKVEGELRKHAFRDGELKDVIIMGVLKEDFLENHSEEN